MPMRSRMSSIMSQIEPEHPELFALNLKNCWWWLLTLSSTNINQSAPNLVKMYMTIRSRMSLIMDLIRPELSELSAFELENLPYLTCLHSSICKYWPISIKLGHDIYAYKVSDEFDYWLNWTRTSGVICPWIWKNCWWWLYLHSISSTTIDQSAPNVIKMYMTIRSWMSSIIHLIRPELSELSALKLENLPHLTLFTL